MNHQDLEIQHAWLQERHRVALKALVQITENLHSILHDGGKAEDCDAAFCKDMVRTIVELNDEEIPDAGSWRNHPQRIQADAEGSSGL